MPESFLPGWVLEKIEADLAKPSALESLFLEEHLDDTVRAEELAAVPGQVECYRPAADRYFEATGELWHEALDGGPCSACGAAV